MMLYDIKNLRKSRSTGSEFRLEIRNLRIRHGERMAITGPSGCGKSTVLDMLGLALRPDSAEIFNFCPPGDGSVPIRVMEVWGEDDQDRLAALRLGYMGYVLQSGELLPFINVGENMGLTARLAGRDEEELAADVRELAAMLGVGHLLTASPGRLSFGERQRAAIVRALASRPDIILADEPTASLDPYHAGQVMQAFLEAVEKYGATLALVTHNLAWAREAGAREVRFEMLHDGKGTISVLDDTFPTKH